MIERRPAPLADKKARMARNRRFRALGVPYKACSRCFAVKPHSAFPKDPKGTGGLKAVCAPCNRAVVSDHHRSHPEMARERVAKWRENNPEKVRETNRKWYRSNQDKARESIRKWHQNNPEKRRALYQRRRARKAAAQVEDFSAQDLADYWESLGIDGCVYCGAPYEHADHIQPLALGGEHSRANLLPACADCNLSKGAKDPVEYVNARYGLSLEWPTDV